MPARDPDADDGDDHTVAPEPDGTAPVGPGEPWTTPPRWLELGAVGGAVVLASVGSVGLLLALNERYRTDLTVLLAAPIVIELAYVLVLQVIFSTSLLQIATGRSAGWTYVPRQATS